jgi:hypothetical protein
MVLLRTWAVEERARVNKRRKLVLSKKILKEKGMSKAMKMGQQ